MSYWYVATPFTHYPAGHDAAYEMACRVTADLARAGLPVLSPISHGMGLSWHGAVDAVDEQFWIAVNKPLIAAAGGCIVVLAEGWAESVGIDAEVRAFHKAKKPVLYIGPHQAVGYVPPITLT